MSTYDPNMAPKTIEEWHELVEIRLAEAKSAYEAACAKARADAGVAWDKELPARREAMLADWQKEIDNWKSKDCETLPEDQNRALFERGLNDIDAILEREKAQALENAVAMVEQPETREWIEAMYAFLKPIPAPEPEPAPTTEQLFAQLRSFRDKKISDTDYLLTPDYPISADKLEKVKAYRQALRDLPAMPGAPWDGGFGNAVPWPALEL